MVSCQASAAFPAASRRSPPGWTSGVQVHRRSLVFMSAKLGFLARLDMDLDLVVDSDNSVGCELSQSALGIGSNARTSKSTSKSRSRSTWAAWFSLALMGHASVSFLELLALVRRLLCNKSGGRVMRHPRGLPIGFCLACFLATYSFGQTVVSIGGTTKELRRTAHQLRISVDRLKNAREALKEATDLARRSADTSVFSQLAQDWIRLDKSKAPGTLEDLYSWLRIAAQDAKDVRTYQSCKQSAQALIRSLASLDSDHAVDLWRMWPDPPSSLGEDFRQVNKQADALFAKQVAAQGSGQIVGPDPTMLAQAAARGDLASTARLATQMSQSGDKGEALKLVDQAIADFRQSSQDPRAVSSYVNFVRQLPNVDPDRYLTALNSLMPLLEKQQSPNAGGTVTVGNQTVQITAAEAAVIDMCRNLSGRPDLAMRTLNTVPGLKSKLDRVGGIDNIMRPGPGSQDSVTMSYSIDGMSRTTYNAGGSQMGSFTSTSSTPAGSSAAASAASALDLYGSVRGKLAKNPEFVRQKLADASKSPDQINALINLANRANYQEPDLASMALDAASQLLMQVEPLQKRAGVFQNLMQAYQMCDGEVDADLMQKGLVLVQQLRDEEKNTPAANLSPRGGVMSRMGSTADQLEMAIVAQLALDNFEGARSYLRTLPEELRLTALLRIIQSLAQGY